MTFTCLLRATGTSVVAITYLIWECCRRPEVMKRLKEIRAKFPEPEVMPTYAEASKLALTL
jgi:hypothetical protein